MSALSASRLPPPCRDEGQVLHSLLARLKLGLDWPAVVQQATPWVQAARA